MTVARTDNSNLAQDASTNEEDLLGGIEPAELLAAARDKVTTLVKKHPAATLLGAFAIGFAVARLIRALGDD